MEIDVHNYTKWELEMLKAKLLTQKCPVHHFLPNIGVKDGILEYNCCCDILEDLCLLALADVEHHG